MNSISSRLRRITLASLLLLILGSCEKVVELDIEDLEPLLVVNAMPCADSTLFVNVTYSRFFIDNSPFRPVTDASVQMEVNGTMMTSTYRDGANYYFGYQLNGGDSLTLHLSKEGYDDVTGGTRVPTIPDMQNFKAEIDTLQPITAGQIHFTLNEPASERNYYYLYILERDSGSRWNEWEHKWDTIDTIRHAYFNCMDLSISDPAVNVSEGLMGYFSELLFSDSLINGEAHDMLVSLVLFKDTAEHPLLREYTLVFESLSNEAFRYRKAVAQASSMTQYFAEPARIYTNLIGAPGILAAIAKQKIPIVFTYKEQDEE